MNIRTAARLMAVPVIALPAGALAAQQRSDTVQLEPVVVTATRLPIPRDAVTAAVSVITGVELRQAGIRTVAEALRTVTGTSVVQTGSFGGQTSLFLRGGESDYVKVLLDGVPLNQPGGAFDFGSLTTDNVDRIEVVRGPVSVLYGSDAVAGVVQIFTRSGGPARVAAALQAGTYGSSALEAEVTGGRATWSYGLAASRFATDGVYAFNNEYRNAVVSGRARFAPDTRTEATITLRQDDHVFHYPTDGAGRLVDRNQRAAEHGPVASVEVGRFLTPRLEARVAAAWHETTSRFDDEPDGPADTTFGSEFHSRNVVRRASVSARANWHATASTVLTAGAELERQSQRGSIDTARSTSAYFAQALAGVGGGRALALSLGARLEDERQFGSVATWRAGAAYRLDRATRVRLSAGTGFKQPTFFENYASGYVHGNPDLDPERSHSWEVALERSVFAGRVTLAATYFDQRFRDLIEFTFSPTPPDTVNYFNVTGARASGLEASAELAPVALGWASASYTYLRTRVTDPGFDTSPDAAFAPGRRLLRRPTHSARLALGRSLTARGTLTLAVQYMGDRDDLDFTTFPAARVTLPSYTRVDLGGALDVFTGRSVLPGLAVRLRVENVLGAAYQEVKNFPAPGRTVFFGGQVRFGM